MSSPLITIILVSGAWHTDFHIQPTLPALQKLGYHVVPCSLPTAGVKTPRTVFAEDVAKIQRAIESAAQAGSDVCIVAHSAGGKPAVIAASNFLENSAREPALQARLVRFCFLASFLNNERTAQASDWFAIDETSGYWLAKRTAEVFYNDISEAESKPFVDALVPQTPVTYPESLPETWRESETMKRSYIACLRDAAIPVALQRLEAEECDMQVVELDAGHCPFISQPNVFATCLDDMLRGAK